MAEADILLGDSEGRNHPSGEKEKVLGSRRLLGSSILEGTRGAKSGAKGSVRF